MLSNFKVSFLNYFKSMTIEPMIFLFITGIFILFGSQVPTNILIFKICHFELNQTEDTCSDLQNHPAVQDEVQIRVNDFQLISQWISSVPSLLFAVYAGALSDEIGRKPLMFFPILGYILSFIVGMINYMLIETVPLEFFYLDNIAYLFGGFGIYYLGIYGYGASVSEPEERAHRLARMDGTETIATLLGTLLSPQVSKYLGYYGSYGLCMSLSIAALLYLKFLVKEPIQKKVSEKEKLPMKKHLYKFFVIPLLDMKSLVVKKRKLTLNLLIGLQLINYTFYLFAYQASASMLYLYMLKVFNGFTEADYAYFSVYMSSLNAFFLMVFMPIMSGRIKITDSSLLVIISIVESSSYILSPFTSNLWLFCAAQGLNTIGYCKYSLGRSLISKCVEPNEVGKLFSIIAILISLVFMISNPVVKIIYNGTIGTFPGAYLLLSASLLVFAGFGNLLIYAKRDQLHIIPDNTKDSLVEHEQFSVGKKTAL